MSELNDEQVNKIIAEYMGKDFYTVREWNSLYNTKDEPLGANGISFIISGYYTRSLDALVPVWEKMDGNIHLEMAINHGKEWLFYFNKIEEFCKKDTIQQAAAYATAKCILKLGECE